MKHLPTLKQLEYLTALAETQHFARAAERCFITPSTLSAGIRDLESVLGVAVAERTKRSVLMTPIGLEIAARARKLLRDAEDVMDLAAAERAPMTGDLRLGVIPTISPFLLPKVLPTLGERYPGLKLYLREEQTESVLAALRAGEIDLGLIALPYDTEGLHTCPVFDDPFVFACYPGHPLAERESVNVEVLASEPLMLLEEGHCLRGHALDACALDRSYRRMQFEATSLPTLVQMVAAGLGVTLLPKLALGSPLIDQTDLALVPLCPPAARGIGLVWRETTLRSAEFETVAEAFVALRPADLPNFLPGR